MEKNKFTFKVSGFDFKARKSDDYEMVKYDAFNNGIHCAELKTELYFPDDNSVVVEYIDVDFAVDYGTYGKINQIELLTRFIDFVYDNLKRVGYSAVEI